jgi:hypothetical protein
VLYNEIFVWAYPLHTCPSHLPLLRGVEPQANIRSTVSEIPILFMEPEGSLSCSHEPATGPYSEPDEPSVLRFILIASALRWSTWSLPHRAADQNSVCMYHLSCHSYLLLYLIHSLMELSPSGKIIVLYILVFMFLDSRREDERFWTEW